MIRCLILLLLFCCSSMVRAECVILLHGLARTANSMSELEGKLSNVGFSVVNQGYPSRHYPIEVLVKKAIEPALKKCAKGEKVNFVTHSLGGILVRYYLRDHDIDNLNHVVMLAPPNKGSELINRLGGWKLFKLINGPASLQLGVEKESVPNQLGAANFDVGVIAGDKSINLILSLLIPGVDDGKVSVQRTRLLGMNDYIVMPVTHAFIMRNNKVIEQVIYYLKYGVFR